MPKSSRSVALFCVISTIGACGPWETKSEPTAPAYDAEAEYRTAAAGVVTGLEEAVQRGQFIQQALGPGLSSRLQVNLFAQLQELADLEQATERLSAADATLRTRASTTALPGALRRAQVIELIGIAITVKGLLSFAKFLKEQNAALDQQRKERDEACNKIDGNTAPGAAVEQCQNAQKKMNDTGQKVIGELGRKVIVQGATQPIQPLTVPGLILKDQAGNALEKGLEVLTSTKECGTAPASETCKLGGARTDAGGRVPTPPGTITISVSGPGGTRAVVDDVVVPADGTVTVTVPRKPLAAPDAGAPSPADAGAAPARDGGPADAGPQDAGGRDAGAADRPSGNHFPATSGSKLVYAASYQSTTDGNSSRHDYAITLTFTSGPDGLHMAEMAEGITVDAVLASQGGFWSLREVRGDGAVLQTYTPALRYLPSGGLVPGQSWTDTVTVKELDPSSGQVDTASVSTTSTLAPSYGTISVPAGDFTGTLALTRDQRWTYQPRNTVDDKGNPVTLSGTRHLVYREVYAPGVGLVSRTEVEDQLLTASGSQGTQQQATHATLDQTLSSR